MSFLNPYFLLALAGALVPVLIHILTRDRVQHVAFSTMRFFAKGAKLVVQRKKFQELMLLLLRILIAALLAFIFARPYYKPKVADSRQAFATARVIVVDVSDSMRGKGLPEAMKKEALAALDSMSEEADSAALITFADTSSVDQPLGSKVSQVRMVIEGVAPGYGATNIGEALRKANDLLRGVNAKQKEIVLVSDLQREGWRYFKGDWKLASDVKLVVKGVNPADPTGNLAIVDADVPRSLVLDKQPGSVAVRVANFSGKPLENVDVNLEINGKKVDSQKINIRAKGTVPVRFRHVFDTPGNNLGSVTVAGEPSVPGANVFYFNARTIPRIPVLLINGKQSANPLADAAFFLNKALVPGEETPFDVKSVAADKVTPQDVAASLVTIVANVGGLPPPVIESLSALLARGGGLFFLPGDQVKAETFNARFGRVAPCKLRQILQAKPANGETAESLSHIDFEHPIFETFSHPHHGDLTMPKFARYWETTDTQLAHVLARFGDGRPAILEREMGKGISMLMVSGIDQEWNDFSSQSVFLPFIHQSVRHLAVRTEQRTRYQSSELLPVPEGDTMKNPKGRTLAAGESAAAEPGFYSLMNSGGKTELVYAVNGSFAEANPDTVAGEEITAAIERAPGEAVGSLETEDAPASAQKNKDNRMWWYLLCALLVLSLGELVLGNKTLRH